MKVKKSYAVEFLQHLGFQKAAEWDNEKITERLAAIPGKVSESDVDKDYKKFYEELVAAKGVVELTGIEPDKEEKKDKDAKDEKGKDDEKPTDVKDGKKPAKKKKKDKPARKKKEPREVDAYGAGKGTIRASVNATFSKDWKDFEDNVKEAGVKPKQAMLRLRRATKHKVIEMRKLVQYRLVDKKAKSK